MLLASPWLAISLLSAKTEHRDAMHPKPRAGREPEQHRPARKKRPRRFFAAAEQSDRRRSRNTSDDPSNHFFVSRRSFPLLSSPETARARMREGRRSKKRLLKKKKQASSSAVPEANCGVEETRIEKESELEKRQRARLASIRDSRRLETPTHFFSIGFFSPLFSFLGCERERRSASLAPRGTSPLCSLCSSSWPTQACNRGRSELV